MQLKKYILLTALLFGILPSIYAQTKQVPKTGTIKGIVTDKTDGKPIAGTIVRLLNDTLSRTTDQNGKYLITGVKLGYNSLLTVAEKYHLLSTESFLVTVADTSTVNIELTQMQVTLDEVTVTVSPLMPTIESPVSMRRIGTEEIDMTPGANRDISKVVQSAPGVITTAMQRNDILVRGGGANENKYYLDGIEIPVLNHFAVQGGSGGNASLVNTDLLRTVNFYTGAFPSHFGNGLSSVMDMQMRDGNPDRFKAKLILGASDFGANIDTPVSANGKTTLLASYRRSYLQMLFSVLGLPFLPTYNDYQFKLTSKISASDELFVMGLGSFDFNRLNTGLKDPDEGQKYILGYLPENRQSSYVFGAGYRHRFTGGQFRVVVSRNGFSNILYKHHSNDKSKPRTMDYDTDQSDNRIRAEIDLYSLGGFRFTGGIGGGTGQYHNTTMRPVFVEGQARTEHIDSQFTMGRYELFVTLSRVFFDERFSVLVGLRADGNSYSSAMSNPFQQLSPRLSLSYAFRPKWSVNASIARYYQEPPYTSMGYRDTTGVLINKTNGLRYIAATHYIAGITFTPEPQSRLSLEGFYKAYDRYPVSLVDSLPLSTGDFEDYSIGDIPVRSTGKGRAYGVEFSYRNTNLANTVINLSYTFLNSEFNRPGKDLKPTDVYISSDWDIRHILNISAIHKFERNWTLGAKWYLTGGSPFTPYDVDLSSQIGAWDSRQRPYLNYTLYNTERFEAYHQLDVRVDKVWYFKTWRLGFYIDIQNLYNYKAAGQPILMPETNASGEYIPDPARPGHYKMATVAHDIGGTILPTLGITIEF